jgi:hypothetical protein
MKNIKYFFVSILMIFSFNILNAQEAKDADKTKVIDLQTSDYEIIFTRYGDGKQNLSWEEGKKLFGMGGNLQVILEKLFSEYEWDVGDEFLNDNYYLRIYYKSENINKEEVNQIFLRQLPEAFGANIEKSKIQKNAICLGLGSSEDALVKAKDRNATNKISRRGDDLKIHSVKLQDLERLLKLNTGYLIKMEEIHTSSNRYDFDFNIKNEKKLMADLASYGFNVENCNVEKVQLRLY